MSFLILAVSIGMQKLNTEHERIPKYVFAWDVYSGAQKRSDRKAEVNEGGWKTPQHKQYLPIGTVVDLPSPASVLHTSNARNENESAHKGVQKRKPASGTAASTQNDLSAEIKQQQHFPSPAPDDEAPRALKRCIRESNATTKSVRSGKFFDDVAALPQTGESNEQTPFDLPFTPRVAVSPASSYCGSHSNRPRPASLRQTHHRALSDTSDECDDQAQKDTQQAFSTTSHQHKASVPQLDLSIVKGNAGKAARGANDLTERYASLRETLHGKGSMSVRQRGMHSKTSPPRAEFSLHEHEIEDNRERICVEMHSERTNGSARQSTGRKRPKPPLQESDRQHQGHGDNKEVQPMHDDRGRLFAGPSTVRRQFDETKAKLDEELQHQLTSRYIERYNRFKRMWHVYTDSLGNTFVTLDGHELVDRVHKSERRQRAQAALERVHSSNWYKDFYDLLDNSAANNGTLQYGETLLSDAVSQALLEGREFNKYDFASALLRLRPDDHCAQTVQQVVHFLCQQLSVDREEYASFFEPIGTGAQATAINEFDKFSKERKGKTVAPSPRKRNNKTPRQERGDTIVASKLQKEQQQQQQEEKQSIYQHRQRRQR